MSKITILHLSDLHIDENEQSEKILLRERLIDDVITLIKEKNVEPEYIITTGDIFNKGGSKKAVIKASEFFEKLRSESNVDIGKVLFVPGNHDVIRDDLYSAIIEGINDEVINDDEKIVKYWSKLFDRMDNYNNFISNYPHISKHESNFGSYVLNFYYTGFMFRVIGLNSAWSSKDNNDYKKLKISKVMLKNLYDNLNDSKLPTVTLLLTHHNLEWFEDNEKASLLDFINDTKYANVKLHLHGHVHESKIEGEFNPDYQTLNLVSGIGYPDAKEGEHRVKVSNCRYSIYTIDIDKNIIDFILRVSTKDGYFVSDTQLYMKGRDNGCFSINYNFNLSNSIQDTEIKSPTEIIRNIEVDNILDTTGWVGREKELKTIESQTYKLIAITGIGGQGKSSFASEFYKRKISEFDAGIWVDCREIPDSLHSKLITIMEALSGYTEKALLYKDELIQDSVKRFIRHLKANRILIIFDNVDAYVNQQHDSFDSEMKPFIDAILDSEHKSVVLVTSRPPITDDRFSFYSLKLEGLNENEGIEFFQQRTIAIEDEQTMEYCRQIVRLTNGHPWWLGLIAGQILHSRDSFRDIINEYNKGNNLSDDKIKNYFNDVWKKLNSKEQEVLRQLAEAHRPLSEEEVSLLINLGPDKLGKTLRRLYKRGLLEKYKDTIMRSIDNYQVHPLIREFVHKTYDVNKQKYYFQKLMYIYLPSSIVTIIMNDKDESAEITDRIDPNRLIDSIETCLNSRNYTEGYRLLNLCSYSLYDKGYHHKYIHFSKRILDMLNWNEMNITKNKSNAKILTKVIIRLGELGEFEKALKYLQQYEKRVETSTAPYTGYLDVAAYLYWISGNMEKALSYINDYDKVKITEKWDLTGVETTRALIYRDNGQISRALEIFQNQQDEDYTKYGNIARCYLLNREYENALEYLRRTLIILNSEDMDDIDEANVGYAYFWISEVYFETEEYKSAFAFEKIARLHWERYAPGLLSRIDELQNKLIALDNHNKYIHDDEYLSKIVSDFISYDA